MRALGLWCFDRHRWVIVTWVVAAIVATMIAGASGGKASNDFSLPGTETQRALDLLEQRFPSAAGDTSQVVFHVDSGRLEDHRAQIEAVLAEVRRQPTVVRGDEGVSDPFDGPVSRDGRTAFARIAHTRTADDLEVTDLEKVVEAAQDSAAARAAERAGVQIELGGNAITYVEQNETGPPIYELVGVLAAGIILYFVLGSFSAMLMPIVATLLAIFVGSSIITIVSSVASVPDFATQLASFIALGVGIDYGLLVLNRFRNERAKGYDARTSIGSSLDTAGRAVMFAGITVVIAMCGMLTLGVGFLRWPSLGAAITVALTMLATVTLVPALMGSRLGKRVKVGTSVNPDEESHFWARYSRFAQRRAWPLGIAGILVLLIACIPALDLRMASSDAGSSPKDQTTRKAYDLLSGAFGPGFNGQLIAAIEVPSGPDAQASLRRLRADYAADPGVVSASDPVLNAARDAATITITPTSKPQDAQTEDTLRRLRDISTRAEGSSGLRSYIGGATAGQVDFSKVLADKLLLFIAVVVGLSLLLLMVVFRSVAVPLKAGILNLLSIGTALGVITWVFQQGNLISLIGVDTTAPIEPFLPVMMFAIIFGLSMDYEVFLMTRIHEEWEHTKDAPYAVRHGLAMTGRVVTAAALVMMSVFGALMIGDDRLLKLFGLGFAAAIFFDAFVIRMMVVPSVMFILGRAAWWIPARLGRLLPRISIEGPEEPKAEPEPART